VGREYGGYEMGVEGDIIMVIITVDVWLCIDVCCPIPSKLGGIVLYSKLITKIAIGRLFFF
jgi:hypothetical protein